MSVFLMLFLHVIRFFVLASVLFNTCVFVYVSFFLVVSVYPDFVCFISGFCLFY